MRNKNMSWNDSIETAGYKKWLDENWEFKTQFWKELHDAVEDEEIVLSIAKILNLLHEDRMYEEGMDLLYLISSLLGLYDEELVRVYEKVKTYYPHMHDTYYTASSAMKDMVYEGMRYYE